MFAMFKRIFVFLDMVINYGISPSTILHNSKPITGELEYSNLEYSSFDELDESQNEHGV